MKKNITGKTGKILLTLPTIIAAIATVPAVAVFGSQNINSEKMNNINISADTTNPASNNIKPLIPSVSNMYNAKLSSKNGPIVFWKDTITSLDWFGAQRWQIDVKTINIDNKHPFTENGSSGTSWKRAWLNFDLDKTNDILYVLSNSKANSYQYLVAINMQNGSVTKLYKTSALVPTNTLTKSFYMVKVLNNGNVALFGQPGHVGSGTSMDVIDVKTNTVTRYDSNITDAVAPRPTSSNGNNYEKSNNSTFNLIPIGPNRNLLAIYNLTSVVSSGDFGARGGTSDVWFVLVDDHLQTIPNANSEWQTAKLVTSAITGTKNSKTRPQCDYHVLLDGRIVTVIYDKLIVIDPMDLNNPKLAISVLENDKWIESWSFDSNETLFFKAKNSPNIKQVTLDKNRNNYTNPNHIISPYYSLNESPIEEIRTTANSLVLYNVYGYIGQIMLINSQFQEGITDAGHATDDQIQANKYGLAVAITNNKTTIGQGDTKGLLNTEKAFQKSADFELDSALLSSKLPSEITRNDVTFLNESFLTQNNEKNSDGTLKYEPFVKNTISDDQKKLKLTLHLDQIPWFVTDGKMPKNIVPLKITKEYSFTSLLESRFSWKNVDTEDYDFRNTLPSKLTVEDINRVNPLVSTLTSQQVTINGQSYPKVTYSIGTVDDAKGEITINAIYKYLPLEWKANESNLLTYTTSKKYTIFKSGTQKKFAFVGGNVTDVANIPALKEIKESNVLPSAFANASKQEYLKFIDTNQTLGYPLEKMNITSVPNDSNGSLTITIDPKAYDPQQQPITKTFTGLNKTSSYVFKFLDGNTLSKKTILPSEVNEELFYKHFVNFNGFDSSDFELELYPNDINGSFVANISLTGNYQNAPISNSDFKLQNGVYVAQKSFTGFKTIDDYNQDYQVIFKKDGDPSLTELQKLTPNEINEKITQGNLIVGGQNFKNKTQLAQYFISKTGQKIPTSLDNNANVSVEMYINNGGGEITWKITFSKLEGYPNAITFLETITGFARGNQVATPDVLTFANSRQLQAKYPKYFQMLPSAIKLVLENNKQNVRDFFLNELTGGYLTAFNAGEYDLTVIADDNTGKLNIKITFRKNNAINSNSLLEYNQLYTGFLFN